MEEPVNETIQIPVEDAAQLQALLDECLPEMQRIVEKIDRDMKEIQQLRQETRVILDELKRRR
jgi:hypothetical protein